VTLVAVSPHKRIRGVRRPKDAGHTYDWRVEPGHTDNTAKIRAAFDVVDVRAAFERTYATDAHFVAYVVSLNGEPLARQPRVNKPGLSWLLEQGYEVRLHALVADVDNPDHGPWTPDLLEEADAQHRTLAILRTAGYYYTSAGRRIVQPLAEPVAVDVGEQILERWLGALETAGVPVDRNCRDWTRLFRLPSVAREDGKHQRQRPILDDMEPVAFAAPPPQPVRRRTLRAVSGPVEFAAEVPPLWKPRARTLAEAALGVPSDWHALFMALAGALLDKGVPPELVPAICEAVSVETSNDDRTEDRVAAARTTVDRHLAGDGYAGADTLLVKWPGVAAALDAVTDTGASARLRAQCAAEPAAYPPAAEAAADLGEAIRHAPEGVSVMVAGCGVGKTHATELVALERAARPYASDQAIGRRAPAQSKTAISVDTNALAIQVAERIRRRGGRVLRVFSPLSVRNEAGGYECRYHEAAGAFVDGGQSMQREFCEGRGKSPCKFRQTCRAADGAEGPRDARVIVGNHGLLDALDGAAGPTGLLVVDEPPPTLKTVVLTSVDFETARQFSFAFEERYADALRPALDAVTAWARAEGSEAGKPTTLRAVLDAADLNAEALAKAIGATGAPMTGDPAADAVGCVRAALSDKAQSSAPPVRRSEALRARESVALATDLGRASKVLGAIHWALTAETVPAVRLEVRDEVRSVVITGPRESLARALRREGSCVVLDATPDVPVLEKVVGYSLAGRVHRFYAGDGAPIRRTLLRWAAGARRHLMPGGRLALERLVPAVRAVVRWALEDPDARTLGLITHRPIALAIAHALAPNDSRPVDQWKRARRSLGELAAARAQLAPVLAEWGGVILLGHYGAVRGLDYMRDADCLATLGDPWSQLGDVREGSFYLGLGEDWERRYEALARGELEQAHGRIRAPHRTRPGRALHMGNVLPSGPGWDGGVEFRRLEAGRPKNEADGGAEDLRAWMLASGLSIRAAAAELGVSHTAVRRYLAGERGLSATVVSRLDARKWNRKGSEKHLLTVSVPLSPTVSVPLSADEIPAAHFDEGLFAPDCAAPELDGWRASDDWEEADAG
jgi:hypothetical protein